MLVHFVVMELITRNEQVRIIVRSTASFCFDLQHVDVFEGDFTNYEVLKKAAFGCDAIVRIAAITATNLLYYTDFEKVNVKSSEDIVKNN